MSVVAIVLCFLFAWSAILLGMIVFIKYQFRWKNEYRVFIHPDSHPKEVVVSKQGKLVEYGYLSDIEAIMDKHLFNNVKNHDDEVKD